MTCCFLNTFHVHCLRLSRKPLTQMQRLSTGLTQRMTPTKGNQTLPGLKSFWAGNQRCPFARVFLLWSKTSVNAFLVTTRKVDLPPLRNPHVRGSFILWSGTRERKLFAREKKSTPSFSLLPNDTVTAEEVANIFVLFGIDP